MSHLSAEHFQGNHLAAISFHRDTVYVAPPPVIEVPVGDPGLTHFTVRVFNSRYFAGYHFGGASGSSNIWTPVRPRRGQHRR